MPSPNMTRAATYLDLANAEVSRLYKEHLPNGPATVDISMATLLFRAAELNMKMAELLRTETLR
jgi:hypothetical protein